MQVLLIDDHQLFAEALQALVQLRLPMLKLRHAQTLAEGLALSAVGPMPDLVLLDLNLPDSHGSDTVRAFRQACEAPRVIVVAADDNMALVETCIDLGASGYVPKTSNSAKLVQALEVTMAGGVFLPQSLLQRGQMGAINRPDFTPRQLDVLRALIRGKSTKLIARDLNLAPSTVKTHLAEVFRRLEVESRTQAVVVAARLGMH